MVNRNPFNGIQPWNKQKLYVLSKSSGNVVETAWNVKLLHGPFEPDIYGAA
jgi:hypothetical protein